MIENSIFTEHHRQKQLEKEKEQQQTFSMPGGRIRNSPASPTRVGPGPRPRFTPTRLQTSPRQQQMSPRFQASPRQGFGSPSGAGVHPVSLSRASPQGAGRGGLGPRHQPYPAGRSPRSLNFEQHGRNPAANKKQPSSSMRLPTEPNKVNRIDANEVIKIEPADDEGSDNSSALEKSEVKDSGGTSDLRIASVSGNIENSGNTGESVPASSHPSHSSPSQSSLPGDSSQSIAPGDSSQSSKPSSIKDNSSDSSSFTSIKEPAETQQSDILPPEGLSLESDLSKLTGISADDETMNTSVQAASDNQTEEHSASVSDSILSDSVNIKTECEDEMDLEITGIEPGQLAQVNNEWMSNINTGMGQGYNPSVSGAANQGHMTGNQLGQEYGKFCTWLCYFDQLQAA